MNPTLHFFPLPKYRCERQSSGSHIATVTKRLKSGGRGRPQCSQATHPIDSKRLHSRLLSWEETKALLGELLDVRHPPSMWLV